MKSWEKYDSLVAEPAFEVGRHTCWLHFKGHPIAEKILHWELTVAVKGTSIEIAVWKPGKEESEEIATLSVPLEQFLIERVEREI